MTERKTLRVEYKTIRDGGYTTYNGILTKYCCTNAETEDLFLFGVEDTNYMSLGLQGYDEPLWTEISYCPFCGAKIECVEVEKYEVVHTKKKVMKEVCEDHTELKKIE